MPTPPHPPDEATRLLRQAEAQLGLDPAGALDLAARAGEAARAAGDSAGEARAALLAGQAEYRQGQLRSAAETLHRAAGRAAAGQDTPTQVRALVELGQVQRDAGDLEEAARTLERALAVAQDGGDPAGRADALNNLGSLHARRGDYSAAFHCLWEALPVRRAVGDTRGEANCLSNLGLLYTVIGDYPRALEHLLAAHALTETAVRDARARAVCLNGLGNLHSEMGHLGESAGYYAEMLAVARGAGDQLAVVNAVLHLGDVEVRRQDWGAARGHFAQARDLAARVPYPQGEMAALDGLGEVDRAQGEYPASFRALEASLALARRLEDRTGELDALVSLGRTALAAGEPGRARAHLEEALGGALASEQRRVALEAHELLARTCERLGDLGAALGHHRQFHALDKTLFNEDNERKLQHLSLRTELRRAHERLLRLQEEQRRLLDERDHDGTTGALNRHGLLARYGALPPGQDALVVLIDLNNLKLVNDSLGHDAGDALLRGVVRALRGVTGPDDLLARWGGDEFVLVLPGGEEGRVGERLARAAALVESPVPTLPPFAHGAAPLRTGEPLERALGVADGRMYACKAAQRRAAGQEQGGEGAPVTPEEFATRLARLHTPPEVARRGLALARDLLGCEAGGFIAHAPEVAPLENLGGHLPPGVRETLGATRDRIGQALTRRAFQQGATVWSNDYAGEPDALAEWVALGLKSYAAVPVFRAAVGVGVVVVANFGRWRPVTPQVRFVLELVALRLGHVLEREEAVRAAVDTLEGGLLTLGLAVEGREGEVPGHTRRVAGLASRLGEALGLSGDDAGALHRGAYLHDLGKLALPEGLLRKPGHLTLWEREQVQTHTVRGHEIASGIPGLPAGALEVIRSHHERWDGAGYPDALCGGQIPLLARVFAVCDVYDRLTGGQPGPRALTREEALDELARQAGTRLDPALVRTFTEMMRREGSPGAAVPLGG